MRDWMADRGRLKTISSGRAFELVDTDGRAYLDGIANMWCNVWGHGQNAVTQAMIRQIGKIPHSTLFGLGSESAARLSRTLTGIARGMKRSFYTDNGSSAIEASLKMALQYWKNLGYSHKTRFVSLRHGYHGDTAGAMSVGYIEQFFGAYRPILRPARQLPTPSCPGSSSKKEMAMTRALEAAENALAKSAERIAAIVMESGAQIAGGAIIYPRGYQEQIAKLCKQHNVLLILDEIATGFGRLGNMAEYVEQESPPDIACFGKALTGGYFPLAVTMTTEKVFQAFLGDYSEGKQLYHGHTFTGHAVGCAAALANIEQYEKRDLIGRIRTNASYIGLRLQEFDRFNIVSDIRHKGMLAAVELGRNRRSVPRLKDGNLLGYYVMKRGLELGVFLRPLGNNLLIIPPLAMPRSKIGQVIDAAERIVSEVDKIGIE
jgi:adenosylmethionine-8-amino-7-oxononanoate aminotransferase